MQGTEKLKLLGGLYRARPALTALFLISALALAGLPPFSGFWAKLLLIQAGLWLEAWVIVAVSLAVSVLTLYSMTKIWNEVFWKEAGDEAHSPEQGQPLSRGAAWSLLTPITVLALLAIAMGVVVEPFLQISQAAADQLLDPAAYIEAVAGTMSAPIAGR